MGPHEIKIKKRIYSAKEGGQKRGKKCASKNGLSGAALAEVAPELTRRSTVEPTATVLTS